MEGSGIKQNPKQHGPPKKTIETAESKEGYDFDLESEDWEDEDWEDLEEEENQIAPEEEADLEEDELDEEDHELSE